MDYPKRLCATVYWVKKRFEDRLNSFKRFDCGATAAEYALILALVAVILIGSLTHLGQALTTKLEDIIAKISQAN